MPQLLIIDPQGHEQRLQLNGTDFVIGRDPGIAIPLKDKKVSRRHARIFRQASDFYVEDLGSANGVVIDGQPIKKAHKLAPGNTFEIGSFKLTFEDGKSGSSPAFTLIGASSSAKGQTFLLSPGNAVIGRGDTCDIVIPDASMSRRHAQLRVAATSLSVEDLGSSNGTFVNGVRLSSPKELKPGDHLRVGNVELEVGAAAAVPQAANDTPLRLAKGLGVATVALLVIAAAIFIVRRSGFFQRDPFLVYEHEVATDLATARALASKEQWEDALVWYQKVIDRDPLHPEAAKAVLSIDDRRAAQALLKNALTALDEKRPEVALQQIASIGHSSAYGRAAQEAAEKARAMLADMALEEARVACSRQDWRACHRKSVVVLMNRPDSNPGLALIREAETQLKAKRINFTPWAPEG